MALYRQLQLSFWRDAFVMNLTPEEKFFYVYLLQCSNTKQCGIFELPKRAIEYETGYNRETVDKLLERFINYRKIQYCEETKEIMILNWIKYNFIKSPCTIKCINREIKEVKNKEFVDKLYDICVQLEYPINSIFHGIEGFKEKIGGMQGAYRDLGEEEIKEEIKIEEEAEKREEIVMSSTAAAYRDIINGEKFTGFSKIVEVFNNNIHPITPIELERLQDWKDRNKDKLSDTKFEGANAQAYVYVE
ncbi:hypothetical protein GOM49_04510 [Clostridium bovifaecis]|uniref:DnaD domain protein n=1 Tax=Clostridium bovifaecis TaxID=2184719 RepID=A0A6I6EW96_9CLOT|nr:hypothetical protein GOM49_04510 [Clostridium bovifaecis]